MFSPEFLLALRFTTVASLFIGVWEFSRKSPLYQEMVQHFLVVAAPMALIFGLIAYAASRVPVDYPDDHWNDDDKRNPRT